MPKTPQFSSDKIGTKITGKYGIYDYEMYYLPIPERNKDLLEELIGKILARQEKSTDKGTDKGTTKPCLDTPREEIISYNTENTIHAFGFIRDPLFPEDEASGSIQIKYNGDIYLSDLCRNYTTKRSSTNESPIKVLFGFFENIIKTELGRSKVRLMVLFKKNNVIQDGNDILQKIYLKYGFYVRTTYTNTHADGIKYEYIVMEKNLATPIPLAKSKSKTPQSKSKTPQSKSKTPRVSSIVSKNKPANKSRKAKRSE
jgi:hypothetical protein